MIPWPNKPIKALGVFFGYDKEEVRKSNWEYKLEKIDAMLNGWKKRYLTVFGKITVLRCLALSKIIYLASMIETPKNVITRLKNSVNDTVLTLVGNW